MDKYRKYRQSEENSKCNFCIDEPVNIDHVFTHWKILKNIFPYDMIAEHHDLIIPKRHFHSESEMTPQERAELIYIKTELLPVKKKYDIVWENFPHLRSVEHYHVHIIRFKR